MYSNHWGCKNTLSAVTFEPLMLSTSLYTFLFLNIIYYWSKSVTNRFVWHLVLNNSKNIKKVVTKFLDDFGQISEFLTKDTFGSNAKFEFLEKFDAKNKLFDSFPFQKWFKVTALNVVYQHLNVGTGPALPFVHILHRFRHSCLMPFLILKWMYFSLSYKPLCIWELFKKRRCFRLVPKSRLS